MPKVMICPANYETVRESVDRAFKLFPLKIKGKNVLIKPNVLRASNAEEGIVTHPAVLKAVVEKVEEMEPAAIVVGDNPGLFGYGKNEECFKKTGLMEAAKGYYQNIGNDSVKVNFNVDFMPVISLSRAVLKADVIISLPKFKTHGLTVITGAIKNSYGFLPGALKAKLHRAAGSPERFHDLLIDLFQLRVPDFFLMDAVVGMEGNGPSCKDLRKIGLILASDNAVAMDAVMAVMVGIDPERIRFLRKAKEAGMGDFDLRSIDIIGLLKPLPDFKLPPFSDQPTVANEAIKSIVHERSLLRPKVDPELCTCCGTCVDQCPVSALSMEGACPRVDADICIACFCCQEICPEKALALC